jgi:hypothetical protein
MAKKQRNRKPKRTTTTVVVRGRGDYTMTDAEYASMQNRIKDLESRLLKSDQFKNRLSSGGGQLARSIANRIPIPGLGDIAEKAGSTAGGYLARLFGHGDFKISGNSLMNIGTSQSASAVPMFAKDGKRGVRVVEREYLGDIIASTTAGAFNLQSFNVNPSDPTTFPWLSSIAPLFDQWEPNGIIFEYVSTSSDFNGSSQALGVVVCATDYNSLDPVYSGKQVMEEADYSNSVKASECLYHGLECAPSERPTKLLYTGPVSAGDNLNLYNLGMFQIATQGMSVASVNVGELWVSYDITLYKKQLEIVALGDNLKYWSLDNQGPITTGNSYIVAGTKAYYNLPMQIVAGVLYFPPAVTSGTYVLLISFSTIGNPGNIVILIQSATILESKLAQISAGTQVQYIVFTITGQNAAIEFNNTVASTTDIIMHLTQVNPNFSALGV